MFFFVEDPKKRTICILGVFSGNTDRIELRGVVNIPSRLLGMSMFFYKLSPPWKFTRTSETRSYHRSKVKSAKLVGTCVFLLTFRVGFLSLYICVLTAHLRLSWIEGCGKYSLSDFQGSAGFFAKLSALKFYQQPSNRGLYLWSKVQGWLEAGYFS